MTLTTCLIILLAIGFGFGWVWLQEAVTYMHGILFMTAAAYTLAVDEHVRIDVLYARLNARGQAWVNLLGSLFLLLPTCVLIGWMSWHYVLASWAVLERSSESGGIPALFLLKSFLFVFVALMVLQALAVIARATLLLTAKQSAKERP